MAERWVDQDEGWDRRLGDTLESMGTTKAKLKLLQGFWDQRRAAFVETWIEQKEREN
jgi:hypothetical protein